METTQNNSFNADKFDSDTKCPNCGDLEVFVSNLNKTLCVCTKCGYKGMISGNNTQEAKTEVQNQLNSIRRSEEDIERDIQEAKDKFKKAFYEQIKQARQTYSKFDMKTAETFNEDVQKMPIAEEFPLTIMNQNGTVMKEVKNYKAIVSGEEVVNCPSDRYTIVQHFDAFRPIVEGLMQTGIHNFKYSMYHDNRKAFVRFFVNDDDYTVDEQGIPQGEGVVLGFKVLNSFDGSTGVNYGMKAEKRKTEIELVQQRIVTVQGFRKWCANGMVMRVPLDEISIVTPELRVKFTEIVSLRKSIRHTESAHDKLAEVQYMVEALSLIKEPVKRMIKLAQEQQLTHDQAKMLIKKYVGVRMEKRVWSSWRRELDETGENLWGLYNAITNVASHSEDLQDRTCNTLLEKSADMLNGVLFEKALEVQA